MTTPSEQPASPAPPAATAQTAAPAPTSGQSLGRALILAVLGLVAAVVIHSAIAAMGQIFHLPPELAALGVGGPPGPEDQRRLGAANLVLRYKHFAVWMGLAGAIIGALYSGILACLVRRDRGRAIPFSIVIGALVGGAVGATAGPLAVYVDEYLRNNLAVGQLVVPETKIMMMHAATWGVFGAGIGLATALAVSRKKGRDVPAATIGGAIAGVLGGVLFPFVTGAIAPLADVSLPIPEEPKIRVLWLALPLAIIGLVLGRKRWHVE
jgi:hypothetical protein